MEHGFAARATHGVGKIFEGFVEGFDIDAEEVAIELRGGFLGKTAFSDAARSRDVAEWEVFSGAHHGFDFVESTVPFFGLFWTEQSGRGERVAGSEFGVGGDRTVDHFDTADERLHADGEREGLLIGGKARKCGLKFDETFAEEERTWGDKSVEIGDILRIFAKNFDVECEGGVIAIEMILDKSVEAREIGSKSGSGDE